MYICGYKYCCNLLNKYPTKKRIKLRFNTNWMDHERKKYYDFVDLYVSNPSYFEPSILESVKYLV